MLVKSEGIDLPGRKRKQSTPSFAFHYTHRTNEKTVLITPRQKIEIELTNIVKNGKISVRLVRDFYFSKCVRRDSEAQGHHKNQSERKTAERGTKITERENFD